MLFFLACIKKDIKKQNEQMNLKTFKALFKETGKVTNFQLIWFIVYLHPFIPAPFKWYDFPSAKKLCSNKDS